MYSFWNVISRFFRFRLFRRIKEMNMKPDKTLITIDNNKEKIIQFIKDMILEPRRKAHYWSRITNQTPNLKIGYPAQHLASLICGMKGTATGARGDDIIDGTEIKACSKIDQSDKCKDCKETVLRSDKTCPYCGSSNIQRNNDSKWLIGIRNNNELSMLLEETPRFIFIVTDYPHFKEKDFDTIRIRAFEIWVKSDRCKNFRILMENYYNYIFKEHKKKDPNKNPAPKNLFPDNFPFYMCNPIKTFECIIKNGLSVSPEIQITKYIEPSKDRTYLKSEDMPSDLLNKEEIKTLSQKGIDVKMLPYIDEETRNYLSLRDTDKCIKVIGTKKHKKATAI